ncbi:uncharacterized protein RJT20DRAFT_39632 [Scheffersomyces xylosifermentans]|uniref:uncharacterized protein n=1 Tax=Scheffersomyces xylosifermentans TaxID=1304137 RepID=UPI00315D65BC
MSVDPITCHILDTTQGKPASNVICQIFYISELHDVNYESDVTVEVLPKPFGMNRTDADGRIKNWILDPKLNTTELESLGATKASSSTGKINWTTLKPGIYRVKFFTGAYFRVLKDPQRTFFPFVEITFAVDNPPDNHYHIPLLLSNHSYTTYRGS